MSQLSLTDGQRAALAEVLDRVLSDLSVEIANTDMKSFRDDLKEKRDNLKAVRDQLGN